MNALGMIEVNSIAAGIDSGDAMLKIAGVELVQAQPVCAGKYIIIVRGAVAEVTSSVEAGRQQAGPCLVDSIVIPNIDEQVFYAMNCAAEISGKVAVGVIETFSLVSCIMSSDAAVKSADVKLAEIRLGRGLGGKSFVILAGAVSPVKHAVETAKSLYENEGMIVRTTVIPSPHADLIKALL